MTRKKSGLATPGGADKGNKLTFVDVEINFGQSVHRPVIGLKGQRQFTGGNDRGLLYSLRAYFLSLPLRGEGGAAAAVSGGVFLWPLEFYPRPRPLPAKGEGESKSSRPENSLCFPLKPQTPLAGMPVRCTFLGAEISL